MPKPVLLRHLLTVLQRRGFVLVSQKGSHAKYRKSGKPALTVIVPIHDKEVRFGTFRSILRQADISQEEFDKEFRKKL